MALIKLIRAGDELYDVPHYVNEMRARDDRRGGRRGRANFRLLARILFGNAQPFVEYH